jgi:D-alanyl-D-alanine endopeptidase (penicillin-binding protein 7)
VLWARQPDVARPIASVSKLMACTVAVEKGLDLTATQTMSEVDERVARGGARSRLLRGYVVTNEDLLYAALLGSDNRAVSALGRSVGLDAKQFAAAMTERAKELGLKRTRFGDPTGLDEHNVSTPREVLTMLKHALAHPTLGPILKTAEHAAKYTVGKGKQMRAGEVAYRSTNRLIKGSPYKIYGGKTGFTNEAKYCFTVAGELDHGRRVAMTFLNGAGELTRFGDFRRVATYLKSNPPALIARPTEEAEVTAPAGAVPYKDEQTALAAEAEVAEGAATEIPGGGSDTPEAVAPVVKGDPEDLPR